MKLDRNITTPRRGKYALIKLREVKTVSGQNGDNSHITIRPHHAVDFGDTASTDFFVIRLKDKYAAPALAAYAMAAYEDDPEYAMEVLNLSKQAAENPHRKRPD